MYYNLLIVILPVDKIFLLHSRDMNLGIILFRTVYLWCHNASPW